MASNKKSHDTCDDMCDIYQIMAVMYAEEDRLLLISFTAHLAVWHANVMQLHSRTCRCKAVLNKSQI